MAEVDVSRQLQSWARRFLLLAEPNRLTLLVLIHHAGPIQLGDLAQVTGRSREAVTQSLRLMRSYGAITGLRRDGTTQYELADDDLADLLERVTIDDRQLMASLSTIVRLRSLRAIDHDRPHRAAHRPRTP